MNKTLWTVQILLALLFIYAGVAKLLMSTAMLHRLMGVSGGFMHFVSVCEIVGGLGLVLPGWLRVRRGLTPLAAACLTVIMIAAVVVTVRTGGGFVALFPAVVGALLIWVALSRLGWVVVER